MSNPKPNTISWKKLIAEWLTIFFSILAAFSLDRWNDGRKERENEFKTLTSLIADLKSDSMALSETIRNNENIMMRISKLEKFLSDPKSPQDSIIVYTFAMTSVDNFIPDKATYDMLKNSNILSQIKKIEVRSAIINLYSLYDGRLLIEQYYQKSVDEYILPLVFSRVNFQSLKLVNGKFYDEIQFRNTVLIFKSQLNQKIETYKKALEENKKLRLTVETYLKEF